MSVCCVNGQAHGKACLQNSSTKVTKSLTLIEAGFFGSEKDGGGWVETSLCGTHNFYPTTTISISYESCDI